MGRSALFLAAHVLVVLAANATAWPVVANGDFKTNANQFTVLPGYVGETMGNATNPAAIPSWMNTGKVGINAVNGAAPAGQTVDPFRNNGSDVSAVAFLQETASLSQSIAGFTVNDKYTLTFIYNAPDR